jgi:hypothetical protein
MGTNGNGRSTVAGVVAATAAAALGTALALPAVRWEALHYDEAVTLEYSMQPLDEIVRSVFVDRGGSLLYFFAEHVTLSTLGGVEGLRLPNVVCFALAVVAAWSLIRTLFGDLEAALGAVALAVAPLAVSLATFARMYTPFLLLVLVATILGERAGRLGGRSRWLMAGAATGLLVHVHPIAPLYALPPLLAAWAASGLDARAFAVRAWPGVAAAALVAAPYAYALAVLGSRYEVGPRADLLSTTAGRSVPEESVRVLAPGGTLGAAAIALAALVGIVWLARRRPPVAVLLVAWVAVPILFFTLVPAGNARFYGRYLLPALPAYLLLALLGALAVGELVRHRAIVGTALAAALVAVAVSDDVRHLDRIRTVRVADLARAVGTDDVVLFSSTGTPRSDRPPELLDTYVVVERPELDHVEELPAVDPRYHPHVARLGAERAAGFVRTENGRRRGAWIFRGPERRVALAERRLGAQRGIVMRRVSPTLLLVVTARPLRARSLLELGVAVRRRWSIRSPADRLVHVLIDVDRRALSSLRGARAHRPAR